MFDVRNRLLHRWRVLRDIVFAPPIATQDGGSAPDLLQQSNARYRGILLGGGIAGFTKLISLFSVAITIPLTIRYLESERYGMWMAISSLVALFAFADLGIGSGLVTTIASLDYRDKKAEIKRAVSSAFVLLTAISAVLLIVFTAAYSYVPWYRVFAVSGIQASREAGPSVMALVACFTIGLPFTIVQRLQMGLQESWRSYLWQCAGSLIALFGTLLVVSLHLGVPWLVIATTGGPVGAAIVNTLFEFTRRSPEYCPSLASVEIQSSVSLMRSGALFVALQLCVVAGTASDSLIIAQVDGAAGVTTYAVMYKLFQIALIFSLFMSPLWPAMGDAIARKDYCWARLAMRRAIAFCLFAGGILATLLFFFAQKVIRVWVGPTAVPDLTLVTGFCVWVVLAAYGGAITSLLNNKQYLRKQLSMYATASAAALLLKVPMTYWLGPAGVVWATVVAYFSLYCIPAAITIRRTLDAGQ